MDEFKISQSEIANNNVKSAADYVREDPRDIKNLFDRLPELIASRHNQLVDFLQKDGTPVKAEDIALIRLNADGQIEVSKDGVEWIATASSGHLVLDKNGNQLPQRTRLKFANSTVTDNGTETIVEGMPGPQGERGAVGPAGPQGKQGKIAVPTVNNSGDIEWAFVETSEAELPAVRNIRGPQGVQGIQGIQGPAGVAGPAGVQGIAGVQGPQGLKGDPGKDGTSFTILDIYPTLTELKVAHPTGNEGDAYAVGTDTDNTIYLWGVDKGEWVSVGSLRGPQGPQGVQGVPGSEGPAGPAGPAGVQGIQGIPGIQGPAGERGPQGDPTTVNGKSGTSITLNASDVGALPASGTAVDSAKLGGQLPSYYATAEQGVTNYIHTAGTLVGSGVNGKFKATVSETVSYFTVNGTVCSVKCGEETEMELIAGCWYTFILDGNTVNFKQGGAGLNFKIVGGTTQPTSPKENTIWVNTDVAIGEYQFCATQPTTRADGTALQNGDVWLRLNDTGISPFSVVKKQYIELNVVAVLQWNGTTWVGKDAQIYKNDEWCIFGEFLYYRGNEVEAVTGGWTTDGYVMNTVVSNKNKIVKNSDNLIIGIADGATHRTGAAGGTNFKIDFTPYKTIRTKAFNTTTGEVYDLIGDLTSINGNYYCSVSIDYDMNGVQFFLASSKNGVTENYVLHYTGGKIKSVREIGITSVQLIR